MRVKIILILVALFVGGAFFSVPIAANNSVVWHAEDGKIFLIDKFENTVCFYAPPGFFGKDFSGDTVLSIEIPGEIELLGFNRRDKGRGMTKLRPSDETAGIDRYEVNVGKPYSNGSTWVKAHFIPKRLLEKDAVLKWWWKTDKMQETAQELKIALLPEMKEIAQPKRLSVMLWSCWNADIDPKYLHHVVRLLQYTGINMATYTHYRGKPEQWKQAGSEEAGIDINIGTGVIGGHKKYLNKGDPKNHPRIGRDGKKIKPNHGFGGCPQYIIDNTVPSMETWLGRVRKYASQADSLTMDVEYRSDNVMNASCFCPICLEAFADFSGLDLSTLDANTIFSKHKRLWGDFRAWQLTKRALELTYKAIKEVNPACKLGWVPMTYVGSGDVGGGLVPFGKDEKGEDRYIAFPFDYKLVSTCLDTMTLMMYQSGPWHIRNVLEISEALSKHEPLKEIKIRTLFSGQGAPYYYDILVKQPEFMRSEILASVIGGADGFGWWLCYLSPQAYHKIHQTLLEVCQIEDIVLDGRKDNKLVEIQGKPREKMNLPSASGERFVTTPNFEKDMIVRAFEYKQERLAAVFNLGSIPLYYHITFPRMLKGKYCVVDVSKQRLIKVNGKTLLSSKDLGDGFLYRTPENCGVTLLKVVSAKTAPELLDLDIREIEKAYKTYKRPDSKDAVLAKNKDIRIEYTDEDEDGSLEICVSTPDQKIFITPDTGAQVTQWEISEDNRRIGVRQHGYSSGIAADLYWSPAAASWGGDEKGLYETEKIEIRDNAAWLSFRHQNSHSLLAGTVLYKIFEISAHGTEIKVSLKLKNESEVPCIKLQLWPHNEFDLGGKEKILDNTDLSVLERYALTSDGITLAPAGEHLVWSVPNAPFSPTRRSWEKKNRNGEITGNWFLQRLPLTKEAILVTVDKDQLFQFYSYWVYKPEKSKKDVSFEWMYRPFEAKPGGEEFSTSYSIRYFRKLEKEDIPKVVPQ